MPRIQIDPNVIDSFKAALHETVTRSTMPAKSIADRLGGRAKRDHTSHIGIRDGAWLSGQHFG